MLARIYRPARNAMQSGTARTRDWMLEFEPAEAKRADPLTGWTGSGDMRRQLRLSFDTRDEAIAYAEKYGIAFQVFEPHERKPIPKSYSDNFRYTRKGLWTH
ncbi:MAG TPA: ETC complex I subunit [Micropepsaceae bacterium]|nr:ETC complex I subunit [Micropepsaceae bacterium]